MIDLEKLRISSYFDYPIDIKWLDKSLRMIQYNKIYPKDVLEECYEIIDIMCLIDIYISASMILEEEDNAYPREYDYVHLLEENEIDVFKMVLLAGVEYFESISYELGEDGDNKANLLNYLIERNYQSVVNALENNFKSSYELLKFFAKSLGIEDRVEEYNISDYMYGSDSELIKFSQWIDEGFARNQFTS